jgi:peptidyl-prolyl cis-trans isomerase D
MLPLFRRKKDWLKWTLLLVIFALGFTTVLLFVRTPSGIVGGLGTQEVALVAGEPISAAQFSRYYRQVLEFYRQLYNLDQTNPDMIKQLGVGQQALNQMINQYAAVHAAGELGLSVSPKEVIERISIMFQENGRFIGTQRYTELLRSQNISTKEFEDSVRRGLLNQKLRNILTDGVVATPDEVKNSFNETNEEVKLRYVLIDSAEVQKEVVTEEMLKEFFEENRESFRRDESRKVSYISVYVSPTEVEVADEAVEAEMTEMPVEEQVRARHILIKIEDDTEKAREKAEEILAEIRDGGNFANLARKHSEDPVSAEKGGDLGFFGRGQMVPEFENVAFDQEVNQISDLVESPFGLALHARDC